MVSLLSLDGISVYLKAVYFALVIGIAVFGVLTLALQSSNNSFWLKNKSTISLVLNTIGALLFIVSQQPYAATYIFIFLIIRAIMLIKR